MAKKTARARASAHGVPGIKKLKKLSFLVIVAPPGTTFDNNVTVATVKRLGASAMPFEIKKQARTPSVNPTRILLNIKGTKNRSTRARLKKTRVDTPDPGDLTITLTNPSANIDPVVTVPVEFVDEFESPP